MDRRQFIGSLGLGLLSLGLAGCGLKIPENSGEIPGNKTTPAAASPYDLGKLVIAEGTEPNSLIEKGLNALGGIGQLVKKGSSVVIKPNFSVPRKPEEAATTNPRLVAAVVKRLSAGAKSVCNRCGRCIKACPNNALQPMPITDGIECFETPYIIPRKASCILCLTCQKVCPTGAIAQVPLEQIKMGSAVIDKLRCIAWNDNKLCDICGEQCPVLAIEGDDQHRPAVLLDKCVGCGSCEKACPVDGEAAIRIIPK